MELHIQTNAPLTVGIDIGTTTVSAAVTDATGRVAEAFTVRSQADIPYRFGLQDVTRILDKVKTLLAEIEQKYRQITAIGLTGQMHGCVYTDQEGRAVSPLYTWQNPWGDLPFADGKQTYCQHLTALTGMPCATGFALVTHFYLHHTGQLPENAYRLSTVMDYVGMVLTGRKTPLVHPSNLASFGFYDLEKGRTSAAALEKMGIDPAILPEIGGEGALLGAYRGIPVYLAIGDNQASFFGAAGDAPGHVLINIGTGSQISVVREDLTAPPAGCELRPFISGRYLECYSALCGGAAYAMIERFYRELRQAITGDGGDERAYDLIDALMADYRPDADPIRVNTCFAGTRADPALRGAIENIGLHNFTPQGLIYGVLAGMADELWQAWRAMEGTDDGSAVFYASGNALRKTPLLQRIIADKFSAQLHLPPFTEEAALGAALYAGRSAMLAH